MMLASVFQAPQEQSHWQSPMALRGLSKFEMSLGIVALFRHTFMSHSQQVHTAIAVSGNAAQTQLRAGTPQPAAA